MQNTCIIYSCQVLRRSNQVGDSVYDIFKHCWKPNEYNDIGQLLLISLNKWKNAQGLELPAQTQHK